MSEMCRAAIEKGIPEIGFSDHFDLVPDDPCYAFFQVDAWWQDLEGCRREFVGALSVKAGIEIGEPHRFPEAVSKLINNHAWDFVIGSLHWVGDTLVFDQDYYLRPQHQAYRDYFHELHEIARLNTVSILGHMDIVKRYGFDYYGRFDPEAYEPELRALLRSCVESGMALEVNTSTLRRPVNETSPTTKILKWFREEGGQWVTVGSDAHRPEDVGFELEKAVQSVRNAGFEAIASYELLQPRLIPLSAG
jgi:histidinol-phosphatase (PHP family)